MSSTYTIRRAALADVPVIARQRGGMFRDMGTDPALIAERDSAFRAWLSERLERGEYLGWLAVSEAGEAVAGVGLWFYDWVPNPLAPSIRRGYILNVYTEPEYRRQGIARRLVEEILAYCKANGIQTMLLHASQEGRPIYEALGFTATNEMRLNL
jgi:GNAT superfamily N-acetyltransferase